MEIVQWSPSSRLFFSTFSIIPINAPIEHLDHDKAVVLLDALQQLSIDRPLQYITGKAWFYGLPFYVDETYWSYLAAKNWWNLPSNSSKSRTINVLLTSAQEAVSSLLFLKKKSPHLHVEAIDISDLALQVGIRNAEEHKAEIRFFQGRYSQSTFVRLWRLRCHHWQSALYPCRWGITMSPSTIQYEPHLALFSDSPLQFYQAIFRFAQHKLNKGGMILLECNEFHADEIEQLAHQVFFCKCFNTPRPPR